MWDPFDDMEWPEPLPPVMAVTSFVTALDMHPHISWSDEGHAGLPDEHAFATEALREVLDPSSGWLEQAPSEPDTRLVLSDRHGLRRLGAGDHMPLAIFMADIGRRHANRMEADWALGIHVRDADFVAALAGEVASCAKAVAVIDWCLSVAERSEGKARRPRQTFHRAISLGAEVIVGPRAATTSCTEICSCVLADRPAWWGWIPGDAVHDDGRATAGPTRDHRPSSLDQTWS